MRLPLPELALFGITVGWGLSFVVVKWALDADCGVVTLTATRMTLGLAVLVAAARVRPARISGLEWRAGLVSGLLLLPGYLLQTTGLVTASAGVSGFLTAGYVGLVPVLTAVVFRRLPPLRDVLVLLLATGGIALIVVEPDLTLSTGELLVALSAFCWAGQIVVVGRVAGRVGARHLAAVQVGVVALGSWAVLPFAGESMPPANWRVAGSIAYLGVVTCAVAFTVQAWGQRRVPPTRAATLFAGEPVFAALFGVWLLGDVFGTLDVVGALLVLAAVGCTVAAAGEGPTGTAPLRPERDGRLPA